MMGGTPSFELTFFGMERSVPDCLIRLIRDLEQGRSEERRVGKECLRLCRSRWSPYH